VSQSLCLTVIALSVPLTGNPVEGRRGPRSHRSSRTELGRRDDPPGTEPRKSRGSRRPRSSTKTTRQRSRT